MSSEERKKILQMVEEGKISAEEAASLMAAMTAHDSDSAEAEVEVIESRTGFGYEKTDAPEFDKIKARARRFSLIPAMGRRLDHRAERLGDLFHPAECRDQFLVLLHDLPADARSAFAGTGRRRSEFALDLCGCQPQGCQAGRWTETYHAWIPHTAGSCSVVLR
jgi:hypothetical protein